MTAYSEVAETLNGAHVLANNLFQDLQRLRSGPVHDLDRLRDFAPVPASLLDRVRDVDRVLDRAFVRTRSLHRTLDRARGRYRVLAPVLTSMLDRVREVDRARDRVREVDNRARIRDRALARVYVRAGDPDLVRYRYHDLAQALDQAVSLARNVVLAITSARDLPAIGNPRKSAETP